MPSGVSMTRAREKFLDASLVVERIIQYRLAPLQMSMQFKAF
jgi:hypothetical protein